MVSLHIRYVVFRFGHHSPHSGYARLPDYAASVFNSQSIHVRTPLSRRIIRERMLWRLAKGTPGYDRASMAAELNVAVRMFREQNSIYHFLDGETTYHHTGRLNNLKQNRLVASFHQPPSGLDLALENHDHLRQLAGVVCLGREQQDYFRPFISSDRIFFVPHGVDTEYFAPPDSFDSRNPNLCLFVGENYRDFPTLRGVIELVAFRRPETLFVGIGAPRNHELVGAHPNLTWRSNVSEAEFRQLYQSAALLVMPLRDTVANNTVLESMACGLPMVVSDVGAIRDYVDPDCAILTPRGDARGMADAVLDLLEDPRERHKMSLRCRQQALGFCWEKIVCKLEPIYRALA